MENNSDFMRAVIDADCDYEYELIVSNEEISSPDAEALQLTPALSPTEPTSAEEPLPLDPKLFEDPFHEPTDDQDPSTNDQDSSTSEQRVAANDRSLIPPRRRIRCPPPTDRTFRTEAEAKEFIGEFTATRYFKRLPPRDG
jgi:hypothetical protein